MLIHRAFPAIYPEKSYFTLAEFSSHDSSFIQIYNSEYKSNRQKQFVPSFIDYWFTNDGPFFEDRLFLYRQASLSSNKRLKEIRMIIKTIADSETRKRPNRNCNHSSFSLCATNCCDVKKTGSKKAWSHNSFDSENAEFSPNYRSHLLKNAFPLRQKSCFQMQMMTYNHETFLCQFLSRIVTTFN